MYAKILCLVLATALVYAVATSAGPQAILLTNVKTLSLYKDRMTVAGRGPPVKQIDCIGGDACGFFTPEVISCTNIGTDDRGEVQWECQAQMESYYRLGQVQVSCEGYSNPDDPYIRSGSCGVEYTLHLTEQGKEFHYPKQQTYQMPTVRHQHHTIKNTYGQSDTDLYPIVTFFVILAIVVFAIWICSLPSSSTHHHHTTTSSSVPPPPPYVPTTGGYTYTPTAPTVVHHHSSNDSGWFSGYMAGTSSARYRAPAETHIHTTHVTAAPPMSSYSSSAPAPVSSPSASKTYTSSGFGGTKKR